MGNKIGFCGIKPGSPDILRLSSMIARTQTKINHPFAPSLRQAVSCPSNFFTGLTLNSATGSNPGQLSITNPLVLYIAAQS